jgi:hypothetical protein
MLDLGHSHPHYVYENDQKQAKLALLLEAIASIVIAAMIIGGVLRTQACRSEGPLTNSLATPGTK